ncbi:MAG: F0F1 ATP synthase subunit delta [Burkholderiales bacterium]
MAEEITIARPYAEAVFRMAQQGKKLEQWSKMLRFAATVAEDEGIQELIDNPQLSSVQVEDVLLSLCEKQLDDEGRNLIRLLLENNRFKLLPQIFDLFEKLKAESDGVLSAEIISAMPLEAIQQQQLVAGLEKKFGRKVTATVALDPELIGGVRIVVGDVNIDASVRGRLEQMALTLKR